MQKWPKNALKWAKIGHFSLFFDFYFYYDIIGFSFDFKKKDNIYVEKSAYKEN